jgi:hypothetical protein
MSCFKKTPVSFNEIEKWKTNKFVNPRTNRKIKTDGPTFCYLDKSSVITNYDDFIIINNLDDNLIHSIKDLIGPIYSEKSDDIIDIISREEIVKIPRYLLISYYEDEKVRVFNFLSIYFMMKSKLFRHPISQKDMPINIFDNCLRLIEFLIDNNIISPKKEVKGIKERSFEVFHKFSYISIYIEEKLFLDLNEQQLMTLCKEVNDVFKKSINYSTRIKIDKRGEFCDKQMRDLLKLRKIDLQNYR